MKCPKCGGTGFVPTNVFGVNGAIKCDFCDGTGVFITNAVEPITEQTNEERLRSATFEELAGAIYEWYSLGYSMGKRGKKLNPITEVVGWLKEKHNGSV